MCFSPPLNFLPEELLIIHFPPPTLVVRFKLILLYFGSSVERGREKKKKQLGAPGPCSHTQHIFRLGHPFMGSLPLGWRPTTGHNCIHYSHIIMYHEGWIIYACKVQCNLLQLASVSRLTQKSRMYNWCPPALKGYLHRSTVLFLQPYLH